MANYDTRLDRLEQKMGASTMRFVWMNPGETPLQAATRYAAERKFAVAPSVFLALERDIAAGNITYVKWQDGQ